MVRTMRRQQPSEPKVEEPQKLSPEEKTDAGHPKCALVMRVRALVQRLSRERRWTCQTQPDLLKQGLRRFGANSPGGDLRTKRDH